MDALPLIQPLSADDKQRILGEVFNACVNGEPLLCESEKKLLRILDEAGTRGFTSDELVREFYDGRVDAGDCHRRLRSLKSRLGEKIDSFFDPMNGAASRNGLAFRFEVSKGRGGRRKGKSLLHWHLTPSNSLLRNTRASTEMRLISGSRSPELVRIALLKQESDFRYSALADPERFMRAMEIVRESIEFMVDADGGRGIEGRIPDATRRLKLPPLESHPELISAKLAGRCQNMLQARDILINCECIEVAALSAVLSMKRKYERDWTIIEEDKSGRMQVLRLCDDDDAAFLITANAPFFFMGEGKGRGYRFVAPIHAEPQALLRKRGSRKSSSLDFHA